MYKPSILHGHRPAIGASAAVVSRSFPGIVLAALLGNGAEATVFLGILVVDEDLAIFAVSAWSIGCCADQAPHRLGVVEDGVHLLEGAVGGLGEEEVDDGNNEGVARFRVSMARQKNVICCGGPNLHDGEDDVGLILD